jgi:signal transduction histidine kinase
VKYSPTGTAVSVAVTANGGRVECAVSNRGDIACPVERDAVFERYFRGRNAEGRPGIGIGLYMARMLARMQDGDVRLDAGHDDRVTFTLVLPRMRAGRPKRTAPSLNSETA